MEPVRALLALLPEPMVLLSLEGEILAANAAFARLLDGEEERWQGKSLFSLALTPEARVRSFLRVCARTNQMVPGAIVLESCDGQPLDLRCDGALASPRSNGSAPYLLLRFKHKQEAISHFILLNEKIEELSQEILQRRHVERALRSSEQYFRSLSASSPVGIFAADDEGRCTYTNPTCQAIVGFTYEESLDHGWLDFVHPEDREQVNRWWAEYVRGGKPFSHQYRFQNPVTGTRWVHVRAASMESEETRERHVGTVEDITERRRTEEKLRAREKALRHQSQVTRTITNNATAALFLLDRNGKCTFMNPAAESLTGYSLAEFKGQTFHSKGHRLLHELSGDHPPVREHEDNLVRKDGTVLPVKFSASPILEDGIVTGTVIEIRDITDEKRAIEERERLLQREQQARMEAEEASRLKDEFLATVSHELRTPLTSILGWLHLLRQRREDEAAFTRAIETIERNAKLQSQLIDDLLDVSRIVTGNLRLDMAPVDLGRSIEAALEAVRPTAQAKGVELHGTMASGPYLVHGDQARLHQVVWNLLSNAVKFTPPGGSVYVSTARHGSEYELLVSDTGIGIARESLPYIFDRFRQVDGTTTRQHGGLGLGLSIVRHLVELHGGSVEAESAGEGQGASFRVRLPALTLRYTGRELEGPSQPQDQSGAGTREEQELLATLSVLVVDDDEDTREFLTVMLEQWGVAVRSTGSASEAFELLREMKPGLLISDLGMPGEDGYSLMRRIRALPLEEGGGVPAIALTAYTRVEDRSRAHQAGYQLHVGKPVEMAELRAAMIHLARWTQSMLSP